MDGRPRRLARASSSSADTLEDTTVLRMGNVGIVVDDVKAAIAFFVELGLELEGEATVEGQRVDRIVGLEGVRSDIKWNDARRRRWRLNGRVGARPLTR